MLTISAIYFNTRPTNLDNTVRPAPTPVTSAEPVQILPSLIPGERAGNECLECPEMVAMPAGRFTMGSPESEADRDSNEGPMHEVNITQSFSLGKFEVTRREFEYFVQSVGYTKADGCYFWNGKDLVKDQTKSWRSPGFSQTDNDPVVCVSWEDAMAYVKWLSKKTKITYRLPTEAEWEYAARAGTKTAFYFGTSISPKQANYETSMSYGGSVVAQSVGGTVPVGGYPANSFGLHDMHGNVFEWTQDCWNNNYNGAPTNGSAWTSGDCSQRVVRGGSWLSYPRLLRSAYRFRDATADRDNYLGFRVARTN